MALDSVDRFLFARRTPSYDCLDFAADVWEAHTGENIRDRLADLLSHHGRRIGDARLQFERLPGPQDPCLVVLHSGRSDPHVGVYLRGRVLHLLGRSPEFTEPDIAARGFTKVRYFR